MTKQQTIRSMRLFAHSGVDQNELIVPSNQGVVRSFALAQTNAHRPLQRSVGAFVSKQ
jgi:hypothetical protein